MKRKLPIILGILLMAVGICALLYPTVSDIISRQTSSYKITSYKKAVSKIDIKEQKVALAAAQAYNAKLSGVITTDAFAVTKGSKKSKAYVQYMHLLDVDGIMGYIEVPSISIYLPIYHGTSESVLQKGAGHLEGSSLPVGGKSTHTVITAHRGLPSEKLFTDLDQLEIGDMFYLHVLGETLAYRIDQILVVEPANTKPLNVVPGKDYATLMTCTPYGINSHRMLVRGIRTANTTLNTSGVPLGGALNIKNELWNVPIWMIISAGLALFILVRVLMMILRKNRNNKKVKEVTGS